MGGDISVHQIADKSVGFSCDVLTKIALLKLLEC